MKIPAKLRAEVIRRAHERCEYCQLSQDGQEAAFHVDHIHPLAHGGLTELPNLALACVSCSLRKGARVRLRRIRNQANKLRFSILATGSGPIIFGGLP